MPRLRAGFDLVSDLGFESDPNARVDCVLLALPPRPEPGRHHPDGQGIASGDESICRGGHHFFVRAHGQQGRILDVCRVSTLGHDDIDQLLHRLPRVDSIDECLAPALDAGQLHHHLAHGESELHHVRWAIPS